MASNLIQIMNKRFEIAFNLTSDLYNSIEEKNLKSKIIHHPSNSIGNQAWCIIGARESYFNAIKNSQWVGFSCSLNDQNNKSDIIKMLITTKKSVLEVLSDNTLSFEQVEFAFKLLEHEIQHHGQLIRYFYSNKYEFPQSWKKRYTV